jgi:hypothetical protein
VHGVPEVGVCKELTAVIRLELVRERPSRDDIVFHIEVDRPPCHRLQLRTGRRVAPNLAEWRALSKTCVRDESGSRERRSLGVGVDAVFSFRAG